jgi:hypothetical protein
VRHHSAARAIARANPRMATGHQSRHSKNQFVIAGRNRGANQRLKKTPGTRAPVSAWPHRASDGQRKTAGDRDRVFGRHVGQLGILVGRGRPRPGSAGTIPRAETATPPV